MNAVQTPQIVRKPINWDNVYNVIQNSILRMMELVLPMVKIVK